MVDKKTDEKPVEERILVATKDGLMRIVTVVWICLFFFFYCFVFADKIIPVIATIRTLFESHLLSGMILWILLFLLFSGLVTFPLALIAIQLEESRKTQKQEQGKENE